MPEHVGLTDEEARAALAPFDPDRLRCEPEGCERWRFEWAEAVSAAVTFADVIVLQVDHELVALDIETGERRWTAPVDLPGGDRPTVRGHPGEVLIAASDDLLVVTRSSGDLRALDHDGRHRWSVALPTPSWIWDVRIVEGMVVTVGPPPSPSEGGVALHAYDGTDGAARWSRFAESLASDHDLIVLADDRLERLDPSSGTVTLDYPGASWARPVGDGLLLLEDWMDGGSRLVASDTGETLHEIEGHIEATLVAEGRVFVQRWQQDRPNERDLLALGTDGTPHWQRTLPVELRANCCPALALTDDGALFVHADHGPSHVLDPTDGTDRPLRGDPPIPPGGWWTGQVTLDGDPDGALVVRGTGGSARVPSGDAWLLLDDPPVVANRRGAMGLELVPHPAGGRAPTRLPAS